MNICANAFYRIKNPSGNGHTKQVFTWEKLTQKYTIPQIKEFIKTKAIAVNYCGKCEYCLSIKRQQYKKRVQSQLKKSKYNYLITLTFDNQQIDTLLLEQQKQQLLNNEVSISPLTNLSKNTISNIIKNWKNKFKKYYGEIDFHYLLCGEYGSNTKRAHYHILLMLDKPIPNLVKENVKGNHFKSTFIDSSQYALYDIEPANTSTNTSAYISKYLNKAEPDKHQNNFNRFQNEQVQWYLKNGISPIDKPLLNKMDDLKYLFLISMLKIDMLIDYLRVFNFNKLKCKTCTQQRPFLKCSRGLGMSSCPMDNYKYGVINRYYLEKYKFEKETKNKKGIKTDELDRVLKLYENKRKNNIEEYFYKSKKIIKKTQNNDIM